MIFKVPVTMSVHFLEEFKVKVLFPSEAVSNWEISDRWVRGSPVKDNGKKQYTQKEQCGQELRYVHQMERSPCALDDWIVVSLSLEDWRCFFNSPVLPPPPIIPEKIYASWAIKFPCFHVPVLFHMCCFWCFKSFYLFSFGQSCHIFGHNLSIFSQKELSDCLFLYPTWNDYFSPSIFHSVLWIYAYYR